ncbi:MAG: hypothetical protein HWE23_05695 [Rhodobacteraceae bacterium]|nr:hypothetical protein [Paracoccaceae bacterium]
MSQETNEAKSEQQSEQSTIINWLPIIAVVAMFITISIYLFTFSAQELSLNTGVWGAFGDYYQGLLNPLIQLLLLIAVVRTYKLQRKELADTKKAFKDQLKVESYRAEVEEVYKAIEIIQSKLDEAFTTVEFTIETSSSTKYKPSNFSSIFGNYKIADLHKNIQITPSITQHALYVSDLLYELGAAMYEYERISNPFQKDIPHNRTTIIRFYRTIWKQVVEDMIQHDLLTRPETRQYYN